MSSKRIAVIMAGGSGERFWPLSRQKTPKQLLRLTNPNENLLEEACRRISELVGPANVRIITGRHLLEPIQDANVVGDGQVWAEPLKRNTLGALVWVAANLIASEQKDVTLAILTADHKIANEDAFRATVDLAMKTAEDSGGWVTCGVRPTRAETGYGYIELDRSEILTGGAIRSSGFREKPDQETAQFFLESEHFLWNSGMFFFTLEAFLRELALAHPEAHALTIEIGDALGSGDMRLAEDKFSQLPNLSIDYAVAEKCSRMFVVEAQFDWDDVGAWDALSRSLRQPDERGNVTYGDCLLVDVHSSIVYNNVPGQKLSLVGLRDMIVVATPDAIMMCRNDDAQRVKEIVEVLKAETSKLL